MFFAFGFVLLAAFLTAALGLMSFHRHSSMDIKLNIHRNLTSWLPKSFFQTIDRMIATKIPGKTASGHERFILGEKPKLFEYDQNRDKSADKKEKMLCALKLMPGRWIFPYEYLEYLDRYYGLELNQNDVLVLTFPKSGTTWMQELLWTFKCNPTLDNKDACLPLNFRSIFREEDGVGLGRNILKMGDDYYPYKKFKELCPDKNPADGIFLQLLEAMPSPRIIKTHIPFSVMPPDLLEKTKVVYTIRNPKDTVISYYNFLRLMTGPEYFYSLDMFMNLYISGFLPFSPYWSHVQEAWERRNHPNLHIVFYENLKTDYKNELQKLNKFLGTKLEEEQLEKIGEYCSFSQMKKRAENEGGDAYAQASLYNPEIHRSEGGFYRTGLTGGWRRVMNHKQNKLMDEWTRKHTKHMDSEFQEYLKRTTFT